MGERSRDFQDLFSFSCNEDVETDLHRTPETFLSTVVSVSQRCFPRLSCRTFSRLPGITIRRESFAAVSIGTIRKFSLSARANLYKLWRDAAAAVEDGDEKCFARW